MVRYGAEHKAGTRERIVRAASRLFRQDGYLGVSIDRIMRDAGLTRGGFYHHFGSKRALFAEVLRRDKDFVDRMRERAPDRLAEQGIGVAMDYLEPAHRAAEGPGCVLTTLTPDVVRCGGEAGEAYTDTVRALVREFERGLSNPRPDDDRALVAAALCVGGLLLARGTDGTDLADRISRACQRAVRRELTRPEEE